MALSSPFRSCRAFFFLALTLWAGVLSSGHAAEAVRPVLGDLDGDGRVTVKDASRAVRLAVGIEAASPSDLARGDVSPSPGMGAMDGKPLGDGAININDVLVILRHVAGMAGGPWADPQNPHSFARLYKEVFLASCASSSCHNANARRAGLNLEDPIEAFALLVNHDPSNEAALAHGIKRVNPGDPDHSFLMAKLTGPSDDQGQRMPYGTDGLPQDRVDMVKGWITDGARYDADDGTLKSDPTDPTTDPKAVDVTLPVPPADKGFQISLDRFPVPYGTEVQRDFYVKTPNGEAHWIKRIDYAYNKGSHHVQIFKSDTVDVPDHATMSFGTSPGADWNVIMFTQNEAVTSSFPPGVGIRLQAHQQMDFQMHYVNAANQKTPTGYGKLVANFWYADPSEITSRAGFLFGAKQGFTLPPNATTTLTKSMIFPEDVKLFALAGHYHSRGRQFKIYRWDGKKKGDLVYQSKEWDDPQFQTYDPPLEVKAGTGLYFEVTYQNDLSRTITEGPYAETQEHCFYFGWFYRDNDLTTRDLFDFSF